MRQPDTMQVPTPPLPLTRLEGPPPPTVTIGASSRYRSAPCTAVWPEANPRAVAPAECKENALPDSDDDLQTRARSMPQRLPITSDGRLRPRPGLTAPPHTARRRGAMVSI
jgi:hypothetical protein